MGRFYQLLIVLLFTSALTGAAGGAARADVSVYPNGLHGPSDIVSGIYPGTNAGNCCWLGAQGAFKVAVPAGADTLLLNTYVPGFAAPPNGQSLRVQIGNGAWQERCCLRAGEHELALAIPASSRSGVITVRVRAHSTFVPKELGLNDDPRHLSLLLRGVAFANARTGETFGVGPVPWLAPPVALALLAVAGIAILVLTLRRPIYGVVALIVTDPFLFAYGVHGTTITLPKVALVAVAVALLPRLSQFARGSSWSALALLAGAQGLFVLTMIPGSVHAAFHGAALHATLQAVQYLLVLVVGYCAYRLDPQEDAVRLALAAVSLLVTVLAVGQVLLLGAVQNEMIGGHTLPRLAGPLEGPNQLAGFLSMAVPAMLAFALLRAPLPLERAAIVLGSLTCLFTFSRGGIGALIVTVAVLLAVRYRPAWRPVTAGVLSAVFAAALAFAFGVFTGAFHGRIEWLFGSAGADAYNGGLGSRVDLWHGAYAMWRSHPLFGVGPGNFEYLIGRIDPGVRTHANGMYFQVLAEQGIAGFVALLVVVAASILVFVRRLNQPLALAACMAAVAMNLHQIVDCMWIFEKVGVFWWVLLAVGAAAVDLETVPDRVAEAAVA